MGHMEPIISLSEEIIGLTEAEAVAKIVAAGYKLRLRSKDGASFMGTCDYRMDRVNLHVIDGIVTKATVV